MPYEPCPNKFFLYQMHATTISLCNSNFKKIIVEALKSDEHYLQVKEGLQKSKVHRSMKGMRWKTMTFSCIEIVCIFLTLMNW